VKPFKDDSIFWTWVWKESGSPKVGWLFEVMKSAKRKYHYAIRNNKKNDDFLRKQRMVECMKKNKNRDFWKEIKHIKGNSRIIPKSIDGITKNQDIATVFAVKYKTLFNSAPSDAQYLDNLLYSLNERISKHEAVCEITMIDVKNAIMHLKADKSDDKHHLYSNHILYGGAKLQEFLCFLFNAMTVHGFTPALLKTSNITSIPKDIKGDLNCSDNYRGIALASCILKIFDIIIIDKNRDSLLSSNLQFAYKPDHSTSMATLVLKECVKYYLSHDTPVYCCMVDASKAFDKVRFDKLFKTLNDRNMSPVFLRLIMSMYQEQKVCTSWLDSKSEYFDCLNGVKQGGVLSPLLFTIYMDVLLDKLQKNGVGCWLQNQFFGCLCYADDLCLLCPSVTGLQKMLHICEEFGKEYNIIFNASKTQCIKFNRAKTKDDLNIVFDGKLLEWTDKLKYLGNWLQYNLSEDTEISHKRGELIGATNNIIANLHFLDRKTLSYVFNTFACHFYGSQAWSLNDKYIENFFTTWNKCVRRLWKLPYTTHTEILPHLVSSLHVTDQIYIRFQTMLQKMNVSKNIKLSTIVQMFINDHRSIIGMNAYILKRKYCVPNILEENVATIAHDYNEKTCHVGGFVKEICSIVDSQFMLDNFDKNDIEFILEDICTR